eukprot:10526821-Heterocapsa_arctica.AAC.1
MVHEKHSECAWKLVARGMRSDCALLEESGTDEFHLSSPRCDVAEAVPTTVCKAVEMHVFRTM